MKKIFFLICVLFLLGIYLPAEAGSIKVIYPSGGETWQMGAKQEIRWECSDLTDVWIALYKGADLAVTITNSIRANCPVYSYYWTVPSVFVDGNDYRIMIADQDWFVDERAWSDNYFTIGNAAPLTLNLDEVSASPSSGAAPLNNVAITARVSGTAAGEVQYKLDCTGNGTWEAENSSLFSAYTFPTQCNYPSTGTYTVKVQATRQNLVQEKTTTVSVATLPVPINLRPRGNDISTNSSLLWELPSGQTLPSGGFYDITLPNGIQITSSSRLVTQTTSDGETVFALVPDTPYTWRVRACVNFTECGGWSDASFTTAGANTSGCTTEQPHKECVGTTCSSLPSCGKSTCQNDTECSAVSGPRTNCPTKGLVPCGTTGCPCQPCDFFAIIDHALDFILFRMVPVIAILLLVIGGIMFFFAGTDPGMFGKAKAIITSTIIGLAIIFTSFLIIGTILSAIGLASWTQDFYHNWWENGFFQIPGCQ